MSRVLIDLPDDDIRALDAMAQANGRSRAAEMREAVALYLRRQGDRNWIAQGAGFWAGRQPETGEAIASADPSDASEGS